MRDRDDSSILEERRRRCHKLLKETTKEVALGSDAAEVFCRYVEMRFYFRSIGKFGAQSGSDAFAFALHNIEALVEGRCSGSFLRKRKARRDTLDRAPSHKFLESRSIRPRKIALQNGIHALGSYLDHRCPARCYHHRRCLSSPHAEGPIRSSG